MELTAQQVYEIVPSEATLVERDDDDLGYLWFADRQRDDVRYVTVSRSYNDGTIYIERDDQKWQSYGGLLRVELGGQMLTFWLDKEAALGLGGVETLDVDCRALPPDDLRALELVLPPLLSGTGASVKIG